MYVCGGNDEVDWFRDVLVLDLGERERLFPFPPPPAYRDVEVEAAVIDGPQSVIIDQAENRLHGQKAVVCMLRGIDLMDFVKQQEEAQ